MKVMYNSAAFRLVSLVIRYFSTDFERNIVMRLDRMEDTLQLLFERLEQMNTGRPTEDPESCEDENMRFPKAQTVKELQDFFQSMEKHLEKYVVSVSMCFMRMLNCTDWCKPFIQRFLKLQESWN